MKRIAVLTSGGDGPGLNACIRAVTRNTLHHGVEIFGVRRGYLGLISDDLIELDDRSVGGILGRGGTFLGTARPEEFKTKRGQLQAIRTMAQHSIEGLVVIGGNGSLSGTLELHKHGFPVIGIPATIDNDIEGTDMSIGVDTALNMIVDSIDRIKDTASSHQRAFLIETMGRNSGYLALMAGIAGGAELILIPEKQSSLEEVGKALYNVYTRGKAHCIAVVAEGHRPTTQELAKYIREHEDELGFSVRVTVLGYIQRGGSPSAYDRILATRMGHYAVEHFLQGDYGYIVGLKGGEIQLTPLEEAVARQKPLNMEYYSIAQIMER